MKVVLQNSRRNWVNLWGGDSTQIFQTANSLRELGVSVDIEESTFPISVQGVDILHVFNVQTAEYGADVMRPTGIAKVLSPIYWDMRHIEKAVYKEFPEIYDVALFTRLSKINWTLPYYLRYLYKYPIVAYSHRKFINHAKLMLSSSDVVLPNSHAELEIIVRTFSMPHLRTISIVVPNAAEPVDFNIKVENDLDSNIPRPYILEVANFSPVKGQLSLIKAFLSNKNIPIVFVGRNSSQKYWTECNRLAKIRGNTFIFDQVPNSDLKMFYSHAKVHILPSLRESPGLATLEAAVNGANCVVSFHGPVSEYFGQDVWYCDPSNQRSIFRAVNEAWMADPNLRLKTRILEEFTWKNAAHKTLRGYILALEKHRNTFNL